MCDYHYHYILKQKEKIREDFYQKLYFELQKRFLKINNLVNFKYYNYRFLTSSVFLQKSYKERYFYILKRIDNLLE